jgi:hypothetical protein
MANELKLRFGADFAKGSAAVAMDVQTQNITITGTRYIRNVQTVGTGAEALLLGDLATVGYIIAHNLDATNFVEIGYDDTGFKNMVTLKAGEYAQFRSSQAAPQARADTASVELEYTIFEA